MIINDNLGFGGEHVLTIPRGRKGLAPLSIDLSKLYEIEAKIPDMERATLATFPHLITQFTIGMSEVIRVVAIVEMELNDAERFLKESKALALLDRSEDVLRSKNMKSSSDTRDAAVILDPDVREAQEKVDILNALSSFFSSKRSVIENSYHASKKIFDAYIKTPAANVGYTGGNDEAY